MYTKCFLFVICVPFFLVTKADNFSVEKNINSVFSVLPGLDIIESDMNKRESRFFDNNIEDKSIAYRTIKFLDNHELRLKVQSMINSSEVENVYNKVIESFEAENGATAGKV